MASSVLLSAAGAWAAKGDCGQPSSNGGAPVSSDCAFILRVAVGIGSCQDCVCDTNGTQSTTAADALTCLKKAVGQNITLKCPSCDGVTTTTITDSSTSSTSTTSTSTTSTTTTIPVQCDSNSDCGALPAPFRCNPNNGICEKPCDQNTDCKDFYLCNTNTHYCQQPSLIF